MSGNSALRVEHSSIIDNTAAVSGGGVQVRLAEHARSRQPHNRAVLRVHGRIRSLLATAAG
eukprot:6583585-Prymnesium_polylepis.1